MTKLASWIVTSHLRPHLLAATLAHLKDAYWPPGWEHEIVVAHLKRDVDSMEVAVEAGAKAVVATNEPHPGGKRNAALQAVRGEIVLVTDDDDFQSLRRPLYAISAYEAGHVLSGIREFRRLFLASGKVVRWFGRGSAAMLRDLGMMGPNDMAPVFCGTARNYAAALLRRHGGWNTAMPVNEDSDLHRRLTQAGVVEYDFGDELATDTIVCQHATNICTRPEIEAGEEFVFGEYILLGEGHYQQISDFPPQVIERLRGIIV